MAKMAMSIGVVHQLDFVQTTLSDRSIAKGSHVPSRENNNTWLHLNGKVYGARPDERGPIGGGEGYKDHITTGDYLARDLPLLIDALTEAKAGQVIFIPSDCIIDLTTHIFIDKFVLKIPAGVTLAGDRGYEGRSGALICSDTIDTPALIRTMGAYVRITGLRIQGPDAKRRMEHHRLSFGKEGLGKEYYHKFPVSRGILTEYDDLVIDNCEISAFSHAAIRLIKGQGHHIHHNYIHHCQYNGLGYGISHSRASSCIEYNLFDSNRHSIAGTGEIGCSYLARHNVECGISLNHCFDMHGGRDRKDETSIAGTSIIIHNNTFRVPKRAVSIRGEPQEKCEVYQNWFTKRSDPQSAVSGYERTHVFDNLYGEEPPKLQ